ncbi:DUF3995 domain-containing protein [Kitasatospora sp. NPDC094019]|uniref:DUF3995 domain-containing protein n=1 Tax=Kitasatospora sp. NPDC094019 TaxID=3364091 RepID=UPI00382EE19F
MAIKGSAGRGRAGTRWGYVVAAWGVVFAVPSFLWATGSTFGARSTVAPELVRLAQDRVPWFLAVLWVTGVLKLAGAAIGLGLTRLRSRRAARLLAFCGGGATILLVWHGGLFVVHGILAETGVIPVSADLVPLTRWYLYLWGPWFIAGGLAFATATARHLHLHLHDDRRRARHLTTAGALGALLLSLASTVTGIG